MIQLCARYHINHIFCCATISFLPQAILVFEEWQSLYERTSEEGKMGEGWELPISSFSGRLFAVKQRFR